MGPWSSSVDRYNCEAEPSESALKSNLLPQKYRLPFSITNIIPLLHQQHLILEDTRSSFRLGLTTSLLSISWLRFACKSVEQRLRSLRAELPLFLLIDQYLFGRHGSSKLHLKFCLSRSPYLNTARSFVQQHTKLQ